VAKVAPLEAHKKYYLRSDAYIPAVNRLTYRNGSRLAKISSGSMQDAERADPAVTSL
jgi:hypothetical protein